MTDGQRERARNPQPEKATPYLVAAFYKFVAIDDAAALQRDLAPFCFGRGIMGTIILAEEGINGTVSGSDGAIGALLARLRSDTRFVDLEAKHSRASQPPFRRMKVKVKPEIVTLGLPALSPPRRTGKRVPPSDWNEVIADPATLVIDTRNDYEVCVGTFENAIDPSTKSFGDFPDFVARKLAGDRRRPIAMFCTGGIRCEKASAYLLSLGFENVAQLDGGILRYLAEIEPAQSLWRGECFVFDARVALAHGAQEGSHSLCVGCGAPVQAVGDVRLCDQCR